MQSDTTPNLPSPVAGEQDDGCGGLGQILMVIVAVVVTVITYGAATAYLGAGLGATITAGAVAGAAGAIASQAVGNALGIVDGFDWKAVALGAIGGAVSGGLSGLNLAGGALNSTANVIVRAAIGNAMTQGIAVATGLQAKFDWKGVAVAAAGAGLGSAVSEGLGESVRTDDAGNAFLDKNGNFERNLGSGPLSALGRAGDIIRSSLSGAAAGITTASLRGGKVDIARIATDAFGNALGESFKESMVGAGQQEDKLGDFIAQNQPAWAQRQANYDQVVGAFSNPGSLDSSNDVLLADAGSKLSLSRGALDDDIKNAQGVLNMLDSRAAQRQAAGAAYAREAAQATSNLYASGAGDVRGPFMSGNASEVSGFSDANIASMRQENLARAQTLAAQSASSSYSTSSYETGIYSDNPGSVEYYRQQDGAYRIELSGVADNAPVTAGQLIYGERVLQAGVGIAETLGAGAYNSVVRILGGVASVPYAAAYGAEAGVAVQNGFKGDWGYAPRSAGAQDVAQVLAPVGETINRVSRSARTFSEGYIGDGATTILGGALQAGVEIAGVVGGLNAVGRAMGSADYIFVHGAGPASSQSGIIAGGQWVRTVTPEMRARFADNGVLDPTTNTIRPLAAGERMAVDHIIPSAEIVGYRGFDNLTKRQMTDILQDNIGLGNLQPLPQSINASKAARLAEDWTHIGKQRVDAQYRQDLGGLQDTLRFKIQNQIKDYTQMNQLNRR